MTVAARFALAIIHFNDSAAVLALIEQAGRWSVPPSRIIVVDNSRNFTLSGAYPPIDVVPLHNPGYGAAANYAFNLAHDKGFDFLLLCTQDAQLDKRCAEALYSSLSTDGAAAIAAPLLSFRSDPDRIFSRGGVLSRRGVATHDRSLSGHTEDAYPVHWADGAVLMCRVSDVLDVGGFDESYFLYVEEIDLQFAMREVGRSILLVPTARASQEPGRYTDYLRYRNQYYFTRKFSSSLKQWPWRRMILRDTARHLLGRIRFSCSDALRGIRDARANRMGDPNAGH